MKFFIRHVRLILLFLGLLITLAACFSRSPETKPEQEETKLRITVLFNNIEAVEGLKTEWGFSCLIEGMDKTLLFDTGLEGGILMSNMEKMGVDPQCVDLAFLSHFHGDHTRGLERVVQANPNLTVFMPQSFPADFQEKVKGFPAHVRTVGGHVMLFDRCWSTGEMGSSIIEQSMIIDHPKGLVIVSGCAHPGIVAIAERARRILDKEIYFVVGGYHLMEKSDQELRDIIAAFQRMGVKKVAPTHCTGERAMELFREAFGENFVEAGCGEVIEI